MDEKDLKDLFAGIAMNGLLATFAGPGEKTINGEDIARHAYEMAICMMREREKRR